MVDQYTVTTDNPQQGKSQSVQGLHDAVKLAEAWSPAPRELCDLKPGESHTVTITVTREDPNPRLRDVKVGQEVDWQGLRWLSVFPGDIDGKTRRLACLEGPQKGDTVSFGINDPLADERVSLVKNKEDD